MNPQNKQMENHGIDYDTPLNENRTDDTTASSTDCTSVNDGNVTNNCDTQSELTPLNIETMGHRLSSFDYSAHHEGKYETIFLSSPGNLLIVYNFNLI